MLRKNPFHLIEPPWHGLALKPDKGALIVIDDRQIMSTDLCNVVSGKTAYIAGTNQKIFEKICEFVDVEVLDFFDMRVSDISALRNVTRLSHLAIRTNSKLSNIDSMIDLKLKSLVLEDTPKIANLDPISSVKTLEAIRISGGRWKPNSVITLEPLKDLPLLQELEVSNLKIGNGGIEPLAKCSSLLALDISNQFPTEQFAYLAANMPKTKCDQFKAWTKGWIEVGKRADEVSDVMITGNRKPFLNSLKDSEKIRKYEIAFDEMVRKFAADPSLQD